MTFELPKSLETGVQALDDEHRELIARVNLIAEAEQAGAAALAQALAAFRADLVAHFRHEEVHLATAGYPRVAAHAAHHAEIAAGLDRLIERVQAGHAIDDVAKICFHELVSVVLTRDMQFLNWLAEHRMRARSAG